MFINYDDLEMLEFFENNPINVGEDGGGLLIYSLEDSTSFAMTLIMDVYAKLISINILYKRNIVFSGEFDGIVEIKKSDTVLIIDLEDRRRLVLKKYPCLGLIIEKT